MHCNLAKREKGRLCLSVCETNQPDAVSCLVYGSKTKTLLLLFFAIVRIFSLLLCRCCRFALAKLEAQHCEYGEKEREREIRRESRETVKAKKGIIRICEERDRRFGGALILVVSFREMGLTIYVVCKGRLHGHGLKAKSIILELFFVFLRCHLHRERELSEKAKLFYLPKRNLVPCTMAFLSRTLFF